ncbi:helix-turn-helix domain-containing protein, partial [Rhodococcus zopfii]|uniref:helix-turn-helix domain-containing protein n=1 Tax=Rhodococcus zopfii TaxID=43772 RepID=UPI001F109A67
MPRRAAGPASIRHLVVGRSPVGARDCSRRGTRPAREWRTRRASCPAGSDHCVGPCGYGRGVQLRYRYRLYPTPGQQNALAQAFGCARVVFNDAIAARGRGAAVPVPPRQPAGDPVHPQRPLRRHRRPHVAAAEDRRCETRLVPGSAVGAVVG